MNDKPKGEIVTAAVIIIGDEILSGRTKDKNLGYLTEELTKLGIRVQEARIVPDELDEIAAAVNACRGRYDYVFTTGGIGPTHDDITVDSIAAAFGVPAGHNAQAVEILRRHTSQTGMQLNEARMRMARTPEGAVLIENPVSKAPGWRVENVYVMAGIPVIAQAMFESLKHELVGGAPVKSVAIMAYLGEGTIATGLGRIQDEFPDVAIGSYPFHRNGRYGATLVCRATDENALEAAADAIRGMVLDLGGEPLEAPADSDS